MSMCTSHTLTDQALTAIAGCLSQASFRDATFDVLRPTSGCLKTFIKESPALVTRTVVIRKDFDFNVTVAPKAAAEYDLLPIKPLWPEPYSSRAGTSRATVATKSQEFHDVIGRMHWYDRVTRTGLIEVVDTGSNTSDADIEKLPNFVQVNASELQTAINNSTIGSNGHRQFRQLLTSGLNREDQDGPSQKRFMITFSVHTLKRGAAWTFTAYSLRGTHSKPKSVVTPLGALNSVQIPVPLRQFKPFGRDPSFQEIQKEQNEIAQQLLLRKENEINAALQTAINSQGEFVFFEKHRAPVAFKSVQQMQLQEKHLQETEGDRACHHDDSDEDDELAVRARRQFSSTTCTPVHIYIYMRYCPCVDTHIQLISASALARFWLSKTRNFSTRRTTCGPKYLPLIFSAKSSTRITSGPTGS